MERSLDKLDPLFRQKVELRLKEVGDKVFITESFRTLKRQRELYAQGRTTPGKIVTWTTDSMHTKGKAVDIGFLGPDLYPPKKDSRRFNLAKIGKMYGLSWGGDWASQKDYPHFESDSRSLFQCVADNSTAWMEAKDQQTKDLLHKANENIRESLGIS